MEKSATLGSLDKDMCQYYSRNNYSKKDNIFCYEPSRKRISQFYSSMADHFYQNKIKAPQDSSRRKPLKLNSHKYQNIKDPLRTCLPKTIFQNNSISTKGMRETGMSIVPMFSQLQATKKQKYNIAQQIRELLERDIKQMAQQKQEVVFRKHFPLKGETKAPIRKEIKTEELIREFNRLLLKYKNNRLNIGTSLNLLEKENRNFMSTFENSGEQKFKILNLFKKLYAQTKSTDINKKLIDYLLKFHLNDHFTKKVNLNSANNSNTSTPNLQKSINDSPVASVNMAYQQQKNRYLNENGLGKVTQARQKLKARSQTCHKQLKRESVE